MANLPVWLCTALIIMLAACGSQDEASGEPDGVRALVARMAQGYEDALTGRCTCLVEQGFLYESNDECREALGWKPTVEQCIADAFEQDGTPELEDALRCHVDHLDEANACFSSASCEEMIEGACDAAAAQNPCGQAMVELFAFTYEHCPELELGAQ